MSELSRRGFIGSAAPGGNAGNGRKEAEAGDPSFMNNVPTRSRGQRAADLQVRAGESKGKVIGGSSGKEATVEQLPISKGIAGVSMRLEPGAMRELHWHATAAEWAFVIEGNVRTTVIDPQGYSETNDFEPGDIWYFPRGHGHMLECLGDKPCHFTPKERAAPTRWTRWQSPRPPRRSSTPARRRRRPTGSARSSPPASAA